MDSTANKATSSINEDQEACVDAMVFSNSIVFPMVLNAAIELDLFTIIAKAGPGAHISASEIASQLPTQNPDAASMLERMLRLFASHSLLTYSLHTLEDGIVEKRYGLTPASVFFVPHHDEGRLYHLVALGSHPASMEVWRNMKYRILEDGNLFDKIHGTSVFEYMNKDPNFKNTFYQAIDGLSTLVMNAILDIYKGFDGLTSLVDVGGGIGKSVQMIISKYPSIRGINFDLPRVTETAPSYPGIQHVGGDMFSIVPTGDAIMIKDTCHSWNDEKCLKLIRNCYDVLPDNGKLIIINAVLPEQPESSKTSIYVSTLDNVMLAHSQTAGQERTTKEFETLCKKAGFSKFQVACVAYGIWAVMESYK